MGVDRADDHGLEQERVERSATGDPGTCDLREVVNGNLWRQPGLDQRIQEEWITDIERASLAPLASFARNLRRDFDAVRNGLPLPHSSGAVEGNINRLKMLKRQMFGRASLDLLRKRVLLTQ